MVGIDHGRVHSAVKTYLQLGWLTTDDLATKIVELLELEADAIAKLATLEVEQQLQHRLLENMRRENDSLLRYEKDLTWVRSELTQKSMEVAQLTLKILDLEDELDKLRPTEAAHENT